MSAASLELPFPKPSLSRAGMEQPAPPGKSNPGECQVISWQFRHAANMAFTANKNAANPSLETNLSAVPLCLEASISPSLNAFNARLRLCLLPFPLRNNAYGMRSSVSNFPIVSFSADLLPDALPFPPARAVSSSPDSPSLTPCRNGILRGTPSSGKVLSPFSAFCYIIFRKLPIRILL